MLVHTISAEEGRVEGEEVRKTAARWQHPNQQHTQETGAERLSLARKRLNTISEEKV